MAFAKANGTQAFITEANKGKQGQFVERDLYVLAVCTDDFKYVAQPLNPRAIGLDCRTTKDVNGRFFVKEFVELAIRSGSGAV